MRKLSSHLLLMQIFCLVIPLKATTYTATSSGNWNSSSTWSSATVPSNGITVTIPSGITVTMDIVSSTFTSMAVNINGTLAFNNGMKLNVDCNSRVTVSSTGQLTGGNPGSKIVVCGTTVWNGGSPLSGPASWGSVLPVKLVNFHLENSVNSVKLNWITASESDNDHFVIQRCVVKNEIEDIGKVTGSGNSNVYQYYSFSDNSPPSVQSYYRLKQVDFNGSTNLSSWIENSHKTNADKINFNPNPADRLCTITLNNTSSTIPSNTLTIYNQKGIIVLQQPFNTTATINISQLTHGIYIAEIKDKEGSRVVGKVVKE